MLRTAGATDVAQKKPAPSGRGVRARIAVNESEYRVHDLSRRGFAICPASQLPDGTVTHVSFKLPAGLSISLLARVTRTGQHDQWFEFTEADTEVLDLLLLSGRAASVH